MITRVELKNGEPASRMRIDNAVGYAVTDQDGWLQAEIIGTKPLEVSKNGVATCTIELPELEIKQGVAFVENLVCNN